MDKRVFRMAILTIISAFILVLVIVYATNSDRIGELFGKDNKADTADVAASYVSDTGIIEGDQIGDNLDAFLYDESCFDENDVVPSIVVIKENESDAGNSASSGASDEDNDSKDTDDKKGLGKAVVGELENPNPPVNYDYEASLAGSTLPPVEGTPVGNASAGN